MFLEAHLTLPLPADEAQCAVEQALSGHALHHHAQRAMDEGLDILLDVRPARLPHGLSKTVVARTLPARRVGTTAVIPLRWEATGPASHFYPSLDANIGITPSDPLTSVLSIVGSYAPPLGGLGAGLDRLALSRVAQATVEAFLHQLAAEAVPQQHPSRRGGRHHVPGNASTPATG
ncbi:MAG: hypothetical protein QOJ03_962 [Frankiaceae bacterium]|jgi:hypothetical protein|nr:hypothetical protein [Frankiaceae bacterium]